MLDSNGDQSSVCEGLLGNKVNRLMR